MTTHIPRTRHRWGALAVAGACALALVGCSGLTPGSDNASSSSSSSSAGQSAASGSSAGSGSSASSGSSGSAASGSAAASGSGSASAVSTTVPKEKAELTLAFTDSPDMTKALVKAFHDKYPQVTIKPQYTQFDDYVKSLKLSMSSDTAPDIAQYNAAMKDMSAAGLILDLTPYEKAYGWDSSFPKSALDMLRVDKTGKILGTGSLIAIPGGLSLVGVFYNKKLLKKAGIDSPPTTLGELEKDFATVKDAGMTPLTVGALDAGGLHLWAELVNVLAGAKPFTTWIDGKAGSDISTMDGALEATEKMADYAKKGYFQEGANGLKESDAPAKFANGSSVFLVDGNWAAAQLAKEMGNNVGFFVMPPVDKGGPAVGNGFSVSYAISSKSDHKAAAAAFLNFLQSPEAAKIEYAGGFLPPNAEAAPDATGVQADLKAANEAVVADDGLIPFPDFSAPAMLDTIESGIQKLNAGRMKPQDFLDSMQKVWTDYHGS